MIAILAIGETFVIITGGIDLSVGAVAGFVSMMVALLLTHDLGLASTIAGAVAISLGIGIFIGLFHAFGIVQIGLPPFIMTLATHVRPARHRPAHHQWRDHFDHQRRLHRLLAPGFLGFPWTDGSWFEIPMLFWMVILVAIPAYILLHQSRWGRYLFAIGSNKEAARLSGVNVKAMIYLAYILSAFCAAFVGMLLAMRIGIGNPTQAEGWELQAIASSVIGGTSLFGAVGSIHGPLIGSFILTTINNGANLLNLNPFWQRIITGALIIVIVYFDSLRRGKR